MPFVQGINGLKTTPQLFESIWKTTWRNRPAHADSNSALDRKRPLIGMLSSAGKWIFFLFLEPPDLDLESGETLGLDESNDLPKVHDSLLVSVLQEVDVQNHFTLALSLQPD